jgi:hypothetical protein
VQLSQLASSGGLPKSSAHIAQIKKGCFFYGILFLLPDTIPNLENAVFLTKTCKIIDFPPSSLSRATPRQAPLPEPEKDGLINENQ